MKKADRSADLVKLLRKGRENVGLHIVKVVTINPITIIFEGTELPLDTDIFEVPVRLSPLEEGARYFALPIVAGGGNRWGLLEKIDGNGLTGSFTTVDNKTVFIENGLVTDID